MLCHKRDILCTFIKKIVNDDIVCAFDDMLITVNLINLYLLKKIIKNTWYADYTSTESEKGDCSFLIWEKGSRNQAVSCPEAIFDQT